MCSLTTEFVSRWRQFKVLLNAVSDESDEKGYFLQSVFSYYRVCSLTTECVLLLQNVFSCLTTECVLLHYNVFSSYDVCLLLYI